MLSVLVGVAGVTTAKSNSWLLLFTVLNLDGATSTRDGSVSTVATLLPSQAICFDVGQAHQTSVRTGTAGGYLSYATAWSCHYVEATSSSPALMMMTITGYDGSSSSRDGSSSTVATTVTDKESCNKIGSSHQSEVYHQMRKGKTTYAVSWSCTELTKTISFPNSPLQSVPK